MTAGSVDESVLAARRAATVDQRWVVWYHRTWPASIKHPSPIVARFRNVDPGRLEAAVTELVRRHENLRTTFRFDNGDVEQMIVEPAPVRLPVVGADDRGGDSFDLVHGPLFRPNLVPVGADEHLLVATVHRAVCDESTARQLERQLVALYCHGADAVAEPVPLPTAEPVRGTDLAYWSEALRGAPLVTQLPLGTAGDPPVGVTTVVPAELVGRLRAALLSALPLEVVLLSAFLVLVTRYTGQDDLLVTYVEHPHRPTLVRVPLPGDPRFHFVLGAVANVTSGARLHDRPHPDELIERFLTPRAIRHGLAPRIHVAFEWSNVPVEPTPTRQPAAQSAAEDAPVADTLLRLSLSPLADGGMTCEGYGDFDPSAGQRLLSQYVTLLDQIAANPHRELSDYVVLAGDEVTDLQAEVAKLHDDAPGPDGLGADFQRQVEHTPDRPAFAGDRMSLTFAQLDAWADAVFTDLEAVGVAPRDRVGLCTGASAAGVAGALGIWKSAATVVPVDRAGVVEEGRLQVVLCEPGFGTELGVNLRRVEIRAPLGAHEAGSRRLSRGNDLAWIAYGTCDNPTLAGVMLTHDAVRNATQGLVAGPYRPADEKSPSDVTFDATPSDERFLVQLAALFAGHTLRAVGFASPAFRLYGPAEAAYAATIQAGEDGEARPVGRLAAFVLDRVGQPVPTGAVGELHLAGPGLFRGYYDQAERTDSASLRVNMNGRPNTRLHRTGQLARRLTKGRLQLLGASSEHVAFNGYRLRLAPIEAALATRPGVAQVTVAVEPDDAGGERLVAYVTADGEPPTLHGLRQYLGTHLPGSVWPAELVVTPSARLDSSVPTPQTAHVRRVAAAWARHTGDDDLPLQASYWGSFALLAAAEQEIPIELIRRHRTLEALDAALAAVAQRKA